MYIPTHSIDDVRLKKIYNIIGYTTLNFFQKEKKKSIMDGQE